MLHLVEVGLANAAVAAILAVVALLVGRCVRRPALAHALWLLVLVKLITPPLFRLPVPGWTAPPEPVAQARPNRMPKPVVRPTPAPPPVPTPALMQFTKLEDIGKPPMPPLMPDPIAAPAPVPTPAPALVIPEAEDEVEGEPAPAPASSPNWLPLIGTVWLAGAAFWLLVAAWRIWSFQRLLRFATPAQEELADEVRMMAVHLGLGRAPSVWMVPGHLPPLIWAVGSPMLLLPRGLLEKMDAHGRSALLLHELAHLARRDHWVRWIELLSSCMYWWYPVAWLARSCLRAAEEEACDAWVTSELPGHGPAYAGALLDTVDFLASSPAQLPPTASAFGGLHRIKQRLATILQSPMPRTVSAAGWAVLLIVATALLLTPVRGAAPPTDKPKETADAEKAASASHRDPPGYRNEPRTFAGITGGQVWAVALSPDEKTLAVVAGGTEGEGAVFLFDFATGKELACVVEPRPVRCIAWSPDGKILATGDFENLLKLRDPKTAQTKRVLKGHTGSVNSLAFSSNSRVILTASLDKTLKLWDVTRGSVVRTLEGHTDWVLSVALSKDGRTAVSGSRDTTSRVWDVATGKTLHTLKGHTSWVEGVSLSVDGKTAATCGHDNAVKLWDVNKGKHLRDLEGHEGIVNATVFSPDGKTLASVSHDRTMRLWDVNDGTSTRVFDNLHAERIYGLAISSRGAVVTGSWDRSLKVTALDGPGLGESRTLQPKRYRPENSFPLSGIAASPDGKFLAVCGEEKAIKLLDAETGSLVRLLEGHDDAVGGVTFSPDGKLIASAGFDGVVILWDPSTARIVRRLKGHTTWVHCVAFSPDGRTLATGGYDRAVRMWDAKSGECLATLTRHKGGVRAVAFHPRGGILASAGTDRSIRIWDLGKKEEAAIIKGHDDTVRSLAYAHDGRLLSSSDDLKVKIWSEDGKQMEELALPPEQPPLPAAFSPAGRLVCIGFGNQVRVSSPGLNGAAPVTLRSHGETVTAIAFSSDGRVMYTASRDSTVRAWPAASERRLWQSRLAPGGQPWFHHFSPDGKWVAHGGANKRLVVQPASFGKATPIDAKLQAVFGSALSPDGKTFAISCNDGTIQLIDAATGTRLKTFGRHKGRAWSVAFSPDGKRLVAASDSLDKPDEPGQVIVWDPVTGKRLRELDGITASAQSVAWSLDGKWIAVGQTDGQAILFDAATGKKAFTLKGKHRARSVSFSPDCTTLAVGESVGTVRLWKVSDGKELAKLQGPASGLDCVCFSPDGSTLAVTTMRQARLTAGEVWLFKKGDNGEFTPGRGPTVLKGHKSPVLCCAWSADGKKLASGGGMRLDSGGGMFRQPAEVIVWDLATSKPLMTLGGHRDWVETLAFSKDGTRLLTAGGANEAGEALLWDIAAEGGWEVPDAHAGDISCAAWAQDGKRLFTGGMDRVVRAWDASTGRKVGEWKDAHGGFVRCIAISPDGTRAATCGDDFIVKVWDTASGKLLKSLPATKQTTMTVAWSPDGRSLAVAAGDPYYKDRQGTVALFDTETWKPGKSISMADQAAQSTAFSPDGKKLAVAGLGADSVAVYDATTLDRLVTMKGAHSARVVAWSRDGKRLATGHLAGNIQIWDAAAGREEAALGGHTAGVLSLSFAPDGRVASASSDNSVKAWEKAD